MFVVVFFFCTRQPAQFLLASREREEEASAEIAERVKETLGRQGYVTLTALPLSH